MPYIGLNTIWLFLCLPEDANAVVYTPGTFLLRSELCTSLYVLQMDQSDLEVRTLTL
jgi:hypothetical protein